MGERRIAAAGLSVAAVFLDRDGVLNEPVVRDGRPHPPARAGDVVVCEGAAAALAPRLTASADCFNHQGRKAWACVNFSG